MNMNGTLDTARQYAAAGLSTIPVKADGSKSPKLPGWRAYSQRRPTDAELMAWFGVGCPVGIGVVPGPASGNLAVLDFESAGVWDRWFASIPADTAGALDHCPIVRTPGGGAHVWVRLPDPVPGTVLARDRDKGTLIEVRGDGHQVVAPGSPASCHPTGREYTFESWGWLDGGTFEVPFSVWFEWIDLAASLTEYTPPVAAPAAPRPVRDRTEDEPGADFNRRGTWAECGLFDAGWSWVRDLGDDRGQVRRPGKDTGVSGTVGMVSSKAGGHPLLFVFSSNAAPFDAGGSYDKFGTLARLKHGGDFKAAARALRAAGYGKPSPAPAPQSKAAAPVGVVKVPPVAVNAHAPLTAVDVILIHFRERYRPVFRRGDAIYTADGETVCRSVGVVSLDSDLIAKLAGAADAPQFKGGGVNRDRLPGLFKMWAGAAWGDLLKSLPDEDNADARGSEVARDEFRRLVRDALLVQVQLADTSDRTGPLQVDRRSLIDWAVRFAKPGPWRSLRSMLLWFRTEELGGGEIRLKVAIRHGLFAQVRADRRLCEMGSNTFCRRAAKYGVGASGGRSDRPHGVSVVVLSDEFVADLTAGICELVTAGVDGPADLF